MNVLINWGSFTLLHFEYPVRKICSKSLKLKKNLTSTCLCLTLKFLMFTNPNLIKILLALYVEIKSFFCDFLYLHI